MSSGVPGWLWIVLTLIAAAAQTARNAMQKGLTQSLGTVGATHVRFLFGLPFALLSLAAILLVTRAPVPAMSPAFIGWVVLGAFAQIAATALMLAAMRLKSFVVATAYVKTEAIQVALFALIFLGERLSPLAIAAIVIATAGVWLMSWPRAGSAGGNGPPALLGLAAGAMFAISAVGFKGAIIMLGGDSFVVAATVTLVCGLVLQSASMMIWQWYRNRSAVREMLAAWRPSLLAGFMGALASQMWFLAFAIASTAHVRTLGMVEILFAQALSRQLFAQSSSRRELAGIALIVIGTLALINAG
ncbi:MAG: EamA family transporter [Lautropia sp.]